MNYKSIYDNIVIRGLDRKFSWKKSDEYFERHHIIPRCMGGSNKRSNLVMLTAKEHFVCHHLLWMMNRTNKGLTLGFHKMRSANKKQHERTFSLTAKEYSKLRSDLSNAFKGRIISDETKAKISASQKLRYSLFTDNEMKDLYKDRFSSNETRSKMSNSAQGKKHTWNNKKGSIGSSNPKAKRCCVNAIEFGCIKDAAIYAKEHFGICLGTVKKRFNDPNDLVFVKEEK